jgi:hypothetical protein
MIRFELLCQHDHAFEGWFRDGHAFEAQAAGGRLACPICGDAQIRKALMAPSIARGRKAAEAEPAAVDPRRAAMAKMLHVMRKVQDHVEQNFDNVGDRFPEEARKMHIGEVPHRDIYGRATGEEADALREEGVPIQRLPNLPKLDG